MLTALHMLRADQYLYLDTNSKGCLGAKKGRASDLHGVAWLHNSGGLCLCLCGLCQEGPL